MVVRERATCTRHQFNEPDMPVCTRTTPHEPSAVECRYVVGMADVTSEPSGHGGHR